MPTRDFGPLPPFNRPIPPFELAPLTGNEEGNLDRVGALSVLTLRMRICPEPLPHVTNGWSGANISRQGGYGHSSKIPLDNSANWMRGRHGVSAYALIAVLHDQRLRPGPYRRNNRPVVCQYRDSEICRAESWSYWTPLFDDGYFYRFVLETRFDDNHKFPKSGYKTKQIFGHPSSTHLFALHVLRKDHFPMTHGDLFYEIWDPRLEICPKGLRAKQKRLRLALRRLSSTPFSPVDPTESRRSNEMGSSAPGQPTNSVETRDAATNTEIEDYQSPDPSCLQQQGHSSRESPYHGDRASGVERTHKVRECPRTRNSDRSPPEKMGRRAHPCIFYVRGKTFRL